MLVTCPVCQCSHLIADLLYWIEDDFKTLEQYMAQRGKSVTRVVTNSSAATAAELAVSQLGAISDDDTDDDTDDDVVEASGEPSDPRRPWRGTKPAVKPIDGISDEQAQRIRDAVRKNKKRRRDD